MKNNKNKNTGAQKGKLKNTLKQTTLSKIGLEPIGDRIIIKPLSMDELYPKTASGIIIPDTVNKEKPEQGTVVAVGSGRFDKNERVPMSVKVGDKVLFSRYGYDEIKYNSEEYYVIREESVLAIIR
jgi:chaperonin GroES